MRSSKGSLEIFLYDFDAEVAHFAPGERLVREDAFLRGLPDLKGQRKILIYICLHSQVGGDLLVSRNLRKMRK